MVTKNVNDDEILDFVELTKNKNIYVRFIEYMPFGGNKWHTDKFVSYAQLIDAIRLKYTQFYALNCDVNDTSKVRKLIKRFIRKQNTRRTSFRLVFIVVRYQIRSIICSKMAILSHPRNYLKQFSKLQPYKVAGFVGRVGFISSITNNFCGGCNRLRLLADGSLKVCLLGSAEISLR